MWIYEKRLEFPVNIKEPNAKMAMFIMSFYSMVVPDGEMGASMRYLSQRYSMPYKECKAVLTDIGTEELAHSGDRGGHRPPAYPEFNSRTAGRTGLWPLLY